MKKASLALAFAIIALSVGLSSCGTVSENAAPQARGEIQDGVYLGVGRSRPPFGTMAVFKKVEVEVSVAGGKIVGVRLVKPQALIEKLAPLDGLVVANGGSEIDGVSGATWSSAAYRAAVNDALTKASGTNR
ncbi:MAG TPA: FMN-binding protein [Treponemataceae bacterium]|nr:FMN-binding protein [Treponemataceae bacterium]